MSRKLKEYIASAIVWSGVLLVLLLVGTNIYANIKATAASDATEIAAKKWGAASDQLNKLAKDQQADIIEARKDRKEFYKRNTLP